MVERLHRSEFVHPGMRLYPIPDAPSARNALMQAKSFEENGRPRAAREIRHKVRQAHPGIGAQGGSKA